MSCDFYVRVARSKREFILPVCRQANVHTLGAATNHPQHFLKFMVLADSCFCSNAMISLQTLAASSASTTLLVLHAPHILDYCL